MHVIQPSYTHTFHHFSFEEEKGVFRHCLAVMFAFKLNATDSLIPAHEALAVIRPYLEGKPIALDECQDKPYSEFLVYGKNYVTDSNAAFQDVSVTVKGQTKRLRVHKEASWQAKNKDVLPNNTLGKVLTRFKRVEVAELTPLLLDWSATYGGAQLVENPLGIGAVINDNEDLKSIPCPRVTTLSQTYHNPFDPQKPMSLAAVPMYFKARTKYLGKARLEGEALRQNPSLPRDTNPLYFQMASQDQRLEGDLNGTCFEIVGMSKEAIKGTVPPYRVRLHGLKHAHSQDLSIQESGGKVDTLTLFPNDNIALVTTRFLIDSKDTALSEYDAVRIELSEIHSSREDHQIIESAKARFDHHAKHLNGLKEGDLLPEFMAVNLKDSLSETMALRTQTLHENLEESERRAGVSLSSKTDHKVMPAASVPKKGQHLQVKDTAFIQSRNWNHQDIEGLYFKNQTFDDLSAVTAQLKNVQCDEVVFNDLMAKGSRFDSVNFNACMFKDADFKTATFINTHFKDCHFSKVDMSGMRFNDVTFVNCTFQSCFFTESTLQGMRILKSHFEDTCFRQTRCYEVGFIMSTLTTSHIETAEWTKVNLNETTVYATAIIKSGFDRCKFKASTFDSFKIDASGFSNNTLFKEMTLKYIDVKASHFARTQWWQSRIMRCQYQSCDFTKAQFEDTNIEKSHFDNMTLAQAKMTNSHLDQLEFKEGSLVDFNAKKSTMYQCRFIGTSLAYAKLPKTVLSTKHSLISEINIKA